MADLLSFFKLQHNSSFVKKNFYYPETVPLFISGCVSFADQVK